MAAVLEKADGIFERWALGPCRSASGMRASKFEQRVVDTLKVLGVDTDRVVREVVVPVAISSRMRRILDRRPKLVAPDVEVADFQKHDYLDLRFDLAWIDEENAGRLMIVEVDGSQHANTHSWFNGTQALSAVSDQDAPPRPQCRDMIKDELVSQALRVCGDALCFFRVSPRFERDSHPNRQAMLRNILGWIIEPKTDPTHLNPGIFAGTLEGRRRDRSTMTPPLSLSHTLSFSPSPSPTLAATTAPVAAKPFRKSRSEPRRPRPDAFGIAVDPEEERKNRTLYNRWCKSHVHCGSVLSRRQRASDSRKRPRDDQGNAYDPRWFKAASRWAVSTAAVTVDDGGGRGGHGSRPVPPVARSWA